ncbi:gamma-glutamylcyclotransferase family protein [Romboutsia sp. 1001713B170207_170306_H8]|uniref:gamma-glutamylcyclotransferase family protein n=1 Tax=Romboutsia sp. 1001713B170207_170306_H8 TaxID=2787112 RepID=UPI00189BDC91|nr:gamma-glutamylcyclotransferase family protein [Romboutsia sp. 1001713B170207_170306_H8]
MKNINVFVYGSLRDGFFNYEKYLAGKVLEKKTAKLENMRLYHMPYKGYPAIISGEDIVNGEIIVIDPNFYEETIKAMDEMEGFKGKDNPENEYDKIILEVKNISDNEIEKCFVYFYNKNNDQRFEKESIYIQSGDWKKYMLSK